MRTDRKGSIGPIKLRDPRLVAAVHGYDCIWRLLTEECASSQGKCDRIGGRILRAVQWIGKGIRDRDPARALAQFMFALETLFSSGDRTLPIRERLADFTAFVLGTEYEGRARYADMVRKLYDKRSDVAHGRFGNITEDDVEDGFRTTRGAVKALLTKPELTALNTYNDLEAWVKGQKYR